MREVGDRRRLLWFALGSVIALAAWLFPYAWMVVTSSSRHCPEIMSNPTAPYAKHIDFGAYRPRSSPRCPSRGTPPSRRRWHGHCGGADRARACPRATPSRSCASRDAAYAFGVVLACLLVPTQATFVPVFLMLAKAGLVNTMTALVPAVRGERSRNVPRPPCAACGARRDHRGGEDGRGERMDDRVPDRWRRW